MAPATRESRSNNGGALIAVVEGGSYARAAEIAAQEPVRGDVLGAEARIATFGVRAFEIRGRKAVLTPTGELLYRRARRPARGSRKAWNAPRAACRRAGKRKTAHRGRSDLPDLAVVARARSASGQESPHTRIEVIESVLGGTPGGARRQSRRTSPITAARPSGIRRRSS